MQELRKGRALAENTIRPFEAIEGKLAYIDGSLGILEEEGGDLFLAEIVSEIISLKAAVDELELKSILSDERDIYNAILTIHPGAGGTERQDGAQMLMRM